jgi:SAM-dependent methyltransferase
VSSSPSAVRRVLRRTKHSAWVVRERLDELAASLPLLAAKERVYDEEFFTYADSVHAPMYDRLASLIYEHLRPRTAVDVGCGTGQILARLAEKGVEVRGLEGSRHAIARSQVADRIVRCNLEKGVPQVGRFDLCICIEVAEHLPPRLSEKLAAGLTGLSDRVVFTAAVPGQGGTHHINEQPRQFWLDLFAARGFRESPLTEELRRGTADIPEPEWMSRNLIVLEREAAAPEQ